MAIALFTLGGLLAPLLSLTRWRADTEKPGRRAAAAQLPAAASPGGACVARRSTPGGLRVKTGRPLRVIRWVDASHAPASAGRMFMSGHMADVCAELDRLAALETSAG
jgi:hypothetical protein